VRSFTTDEQVPWMKAAEAEAGGRHRRHGHSAQRGATTIVYDGAIGSRRECKKVLRAVPDSII